MSATADANQLVDLLVGLDTFFTNGIDQRGKLQQRLRTDPVSSDEIKNQIAQLINSQQEHCNRIKTLIEKVLSRAYAVGLDDPENPLDELLAAPYWSGSPTFPELKRRSIIYARQLARRLSIAEQSFRHSPAIDPNKPHHPTVKMKMPSEIALAAFRLRFTTGRPQAEIASILEQQLGRTVNQGQVSRWIAQVEKYIAAGNVLPDPPKTSGKPTNVDPRHIDMGGRLDGRAPRQRPSSHE